MKRNHFSRLALAIVLGLTAVACSQNDDTQDIIAQEQQMANDGMYHYTMYLNCDAPVDDSIAATRAVTYEWANNSVLYMRYKNGSSFISGKATYNKSKGSWDVDVPKSLPTTNGSTCEVYYFENAGSESGGIISLTEQSACYFTTSAAYSHPSSSSISVTATLGRKTWRLRFKGTSGTTITLPANDNDINYFSAFDLATGNFSKNQKEVTLTVSSGYTPYIYGEFKYSSVSNAIRIDRNDDSEYYYTKDFASSKLAVGESGYLTIPSANSYSGWERKPKEKIDPNATIKVDYYTTFTDGIAWNWTLGSTVNTFDYVVGKKDYIDGLSDDEVITHAYGDNPYGSEYADYNFKHTDEEWYAPNTEYYLCAVAKNSAGVRGPVLRYLFKTNSENLPYAAISNIKAASTTKWTFDITLKNNAKSYYLTTSTDEDDYTKDWHWMAFYAHYYATNGLIETHDWSSVQSTLNSGTCKIITICTWGVDASKNIGNPTVAYGSTSSARRQAPAAKLPMKAMMSKKDMEKMLEHTTLYRINE